MSLPYVFSNFPSGPSAIQSIHEYNQMRDLLDWEWTYLGHNPPDTIDDADGGTVTLGSGSAGASDYLNGQQYGASVKLNRLSKTVLFLWKYQLDSASLNRSLLGCCVTNTNLMGTNITDGFGFFCNQSGGPTAGYWWFFNANGSGAQFSGYTQVQGPATDTNAHTFAIRVTTDGSTLGTGSITAWIDGQQVGNGLSGAILTQSALRMSMAMGNGSAVARSSTLYYDAYSDQQ